MIRCCACEKKVEDLIIAGKLFAGHLPGCGKCDECCARTCEERQPEYIRRQARIELGEAMENAKERGVSVESARDLANEVWRGSAKKPTPPHSSPILVALAKR